MNVCILGDGLVSLTLAKTLINNKIKVYMYHEYNKKILNNNRTIGISSNNLSFLQKEIIKIKKSLIWGVNQIEIYNDKSKNQKIFNFEKNKEELFYIVKNKDLYELLSESLNKENNFKKIEIKKNLSFSKTLIMKSLI